MLIQATSRQLNFHVMQLLGLRRVLVYLEKNLILLANIGLLGALFIDIPMDLKGKFSKAVRRVICGSW